MRKQYIANICLAIILLLTVLAFTLEGIFISEIPRSSWTFPGFIFLMVFVLGVAEIAQNMHLLKKEAQSAAAGPDQKEEKAFFTDYKNFLAILSLMVLYLLLFYLFDFVSSSIIFAVLYGFYAKYPKKLFFIIFTVITITGIFTIFSRFLGVSFSQGIIVKMIGSLF